MTPRAPGVSFVVPCFDEGPRVDACLARILAWADARPALAAEVVWVDDGSRDDGLARARRVAACRSEVRTITLPRNLGRGAALRVGVNDARGRRAVLLDVGRSADLLPVEDLLRALDDGADVVVGRRRGPGAAPASRLRRAVGRVLPAISRLALRVRVSDPACPFRAFRGDLARELFRASRARRRGIDAEVLHLAARWGLVVREVPVRSRGGEDVASPRPAHLLRSLAEVVAARFEHGPAR